MEKTQPVSSKTEEKDIEKVAKGHSDTLANPLSNKDSTAQKIAKKTGVSERTIKRDTKFAQEPDAIAPGQNHHF